MTKFYRRRVVPSMTHWLRPLCAAAFALVFAASASAQSDVSDTIQDTRSTLQEWVETQRIISKEKRDLELSKEVLNDRIDLVQREIDSLREQIKKAEEDIVQADKVREELVVENDALKTASATLEERIFILEGRVRTLVPRLPEPIRTRIKPLSQRIPAADIKADEIKMSLGERFQNVVGVANEVNKFHQEISVTSEVRDLADGSSAEVTAVYLGVSQGYYTGANGTISGVGSSTDKGWVWKENNEIAAEIASIVAIMNNEVVASFVPVPVEKVD